MLDEFLGRTISAGIPQDQWLGVIPVAHRIALGLVIILACSCGHQVSRGQQTSGAESLALAAAQDSEYWILLRDGLSRQIAATQIKDLDVNGIDLENETLPWKAIHSAKLPEPWQAHAVQWINNFGLPWAMAEQRLLRRDWEPAYRSAQQVEAVLNSAMQSSKNAAQPDASREIEFHPAWTVVDQCSRWHQLQRGHWDQALVLLLRERIRAMRQAQQSQSDDPGEMNPTNLLSDGTTVTNRLAQALQEMPPIVLSAHVAARQLDQIQSLATAAIGLQDARGCWYAGILAEAGGDAELAEQAFQAASRFWPPDQLAVLTAWQEIRTAKQMIKNGQTIEARQKLAELLIQTTEPQQRVVIRILQAEALTLSARQEDWRNVVLAWLEVVAFHEGSYPPLALYAVDRAQRHALEFGSPQESERLQRFRSTLKSHW